MIEEIARGLEADGITRRRKAKQQLEELIAKDRRAPCISRQDWSKLIRSYIEFEILEIGYCNKKNTVIPLQNAQLLRSIVKQASPILYCNNSRIPILFKHCIRVCYDLDSHSKYSSIHRDILMDLCDNERFIQCLKVDTLQIICSYLEKISDDVVFSSIQTARSYSLLFAVPSSFRRVRFWHRQSATCSLHYIIKTTIIALIHIP